MITRLALGAGSFSRKQTLLAMAGLFLLNLALRVFYLRYDFVNGDEAVRAITAAGFLDGARLYVDVVTDKPPGATLFYAVVFELFGRSMTAVHLVAAYWHFASAVVVCLIGSRLYSRRAGILAAFGFVYFSTNYLTQDVMAANTELLMLLPYTLSFYLYIRSGLLDGRGARTTMSLLGAGAVAGAAGVFKPVGVLTIAAFVVCEVLAASIRPRPATDGESRPPLRSARRSILRVSTILLGAGCVLLGFLAILVVSDALDAFWRNVIQLGWLYVGSLPSDLWLKFMFGRGLGYVLFNAALWSLAVWAVAQALVSWRKREIDSAGYADLAVLAWAIVSLWGVAAGGRFYGHYFLQVLPAISLLGARGLYILSELMGNRARRRRAQLVACVLAIVFVFGLVRFHHRTAVLAYETLTGRRTGSSERWGMSRRQRAASVIGEHLRREVGEGEALYIWGYGLDLYWESGCKPASRYLTPYYVTGRFYPEVTAEPPPAAEKFWRQARAELIDDLRRNRPRLILNKDEDILSAPYPEVVRFITDNYDYAGIIGDDPTYQFSVYSLRGR